jgi:hypothetical protein
MGYEGELQQRIKFSVIVRLMGKPFDHVLAFLESALQRGEKWEPDLDGEKEKSVVAPRRQISAESL